MALIELGAYGVARLAPSRKTRALRERWRPSYISAEGVLALRAAARQLWRQRSCAKINAAAGIARETYQRPS